MPNQLGTVIQDDEPDWASQVDLKHKGVILWLPARSLADAADIGAKVLLAPAADRRPAVEVHQPSNGAQG